MPIEKIIEICKKQNETLYGTCCECPFVDYKEDYRCYFELLSPEDWSVEEINKLLRRADG
jgi:hypothetical protein